MRYSARDLAVKRAQLLEAPIVLGSATPSLESWAQAPAQGRYRLLQLPERVGLGEWARARPALELIDAARKPAAERIALAPICARRCGRHFARRTVAGVPEPARLCAGRDSAKRAAGYRTAPTAPPLRCFTSRTGRCAVITAATRRRCHALARRAAISTAKRRGPGGRKRIEETLRALLPLAR